MAFLLLVPPLSAQAQEAAFPRSLVLPALQQAFGAIVERHLETAAPADLALWSLRGLGAIDVRLTTDVRGGLMRLSQDDRLLAEAPVLNPALPATGAQARQVARLGPLAAPPVDTLAAMLTNFYEAAWSASPALRQAGIERILQSGFEELFNHLDPYSRYVTAPEALQVRDRRVGQASLGLRLVAGRRSVVVADLLVDGPAARAGLRTGDELLSIDGQAVSVRRINEAAELLEGAAGSVVNLVLRRGSQRLAISLRRSDEPRQTVRVEQRDGILWLRLSGFAANTTEALTQAMQDAFAQSQPPRGTVLDLRGNRGGVLHQAMTVADAFLASGRIASSLGRHPDSVRVWDAGGTDLTQGRPLVVLVDGRTASSAEIVAAALSDRGRAVAVGSSTLGKGLIQIVIPLSNGAEVLISWSRVLAPLGWPVQGLGVQPAICTSLGQDVLRNEMAQLAAGRAPRAAVLARAHAARAPVPASEVTALRGTCPPAEERELDSEVARMLIDQPRLYTVALSP
jgi:carboxyl-terminal processing protease